MHLSSGRLEAGPQPHIKLCITRKLNKRMLCKSIYSMELATVGQTKGFDRYSGNKNKKLEINGNCGYFSSEEKKLNCFTHKSIFSYSKIILTLINLNFSFVFYIILSLILD